MSRCKCVWTINLFLTEIITCFLTFKGEDEVAAQTPEITQRVHHATDEEKLASTGMTGQTTDSQEEREELQSDKEPVKKQPSSEISVESK